MIRLSLTILRHSRSGQNREDLEVSRKTGAMEAGMDTPKV